jgi:site-specific recombinase XerC
MVTEPLLDLEACAIPETDSPPGRYLARFAAGASRETMRQSLEHLARVASGGELAAAEIPWHRLRYADTSRLRAAIVEVYSPAGANLRISALRGVLREAWRLGLMAPDDYYRASDLKGVRGSSLPRGRALDSGELRTLFVQCAEDTRPIARRDAAVLALLYGCGLRRAEIVACNLEDLDLEQGTLTVHGKGRRERRVAILGNVERALSEWLEIRGKRRGALFHAFDSRGRKRIARRMTAQAIRRICERRGDVARVRPFSPHDLRRSTISDLLDAGEDLATVQRLVGHAKVDTTSKYDRRGDRATRRASGRLHVPL